MNETQQANPSGEPSQKSFVERKAEQLRQERESSQAPEPRQPEIADDPSLAPGGLDEPDERQPEAELPEESDELEESIEDDDSEEDQPESDDTEGAIDEAGTARTDGEEIESEPETPEAARIRELTEEVEKAETSRKSMEKDYRHKTHKLAENTREVSAQMEEAAGIFQYLEQLAGRDMAPFQNINWQQLQTNPEQYQQAQQQYAMALQAQQQRKAELDQISMRAKEIQAKNTEIIADHSRGILTHQIPNWGNEVYGKIREFAKEYYDYTDDEFDQIVDWRPMKALYDAMEAQNFKKSSSKAVKKRGLTRAKAPKKRNAAKASNRNAKGQFEAAKRASADKPGNRDAFRAMKMAQLKLERERRR